MSASNGESLQCWKCTEQSSNGATNDCYTDGTFGEKETCSDKNAVCYKDVKSKLHLFLLQFLVANTSNLIYAGKPWVLKNLEKCRKSKIE